MDVKQKISKKQELQGKKNNKTELLCNRLTELEAKSDKESMAEKDKLEQEIAEDPEENYHKLKEALSR